MGEIADGVNALISLGRGDVTGAALSAASMLPIVGDAIGKGGKIARAAIKHGDEVLEAAGKQVDEVLETLPLRRLDAEASSMQKVGGKPSTTDRIRNVAQQSFDYAVNKPRKQGLNRMQLGKDAEIQATRWTRKWAERNGIDLGDSGLHFQVRGEHSIPDIIYEPTKNIMDFKLTPKAIRKKQSDNFQSDFPGYSIDYIFGPGPWRE